jgi:hypothetical protein
MAVRSDGSSGIPARVPGSCAAVPIRWDVSLDEFDHRKTGYALEGKHAGMKCAPKQCSGCHEDIHGGQFATGRSRETARAATLR